MDNKGLRNEDSRWEQAVEWFLRLRSEAARIEDVPELRRWIEADPYNALAYRQVSAAWDVVGTHASVPEIVIGRRDALEDSHKAARHRTSRPRLAAFGLRTMASGRINRLAVAACAAVVSLAAGLWLTLPHGTLYATDFGERRTLLLSDGSQVALDAHSRARVLYTDKERVVALEQGQARFTVAKDPLRPFRVRARGQTVVALGTQFDVELVSHKVLVTLIEGHVAVAGIPPERPSDDPPRTPIRHSKKTESAGPARQPASVPSGDCVVELTPGDALDVDDNGHAVTVSNVDLTRATAWQTGVMFFDNEPISSAVERINRYTRKQVEIDPSIATLGISGVFNAGDTDAFIEAVIAYFPVEVVRNRDSKIYLTLRK